MKFGPDDIRRKRFWSLGAGISPSAGGRLRQGPRCSAIGEILPGITQVADVWADRACAQVQGFGYLLFRAPFPPKPDEQFVSLGFGWRFSGQEFRWGKRADMPICYAGKQLTGRDAQCAG